MARDFFDELGETLKRTTKDLSRKADQVYEMQKLRTRISREGSMADKLYMEIGRLIYKEYQENGIQNPKIEEMCREIDQHREIISGYKDSLAALRGQKRCPVCQKAVDRDAAFCTCCGAPLQENRTEAPEEDCKTVDESAFADEETVVVDTETESEENIEK